MRPHDQYPPWLQDLTEMEPSLGQLSRADLKSLSQQEKERLVKLSNRDKIRTRNFTQAKKK